MSNRSCTSVVPAAPIRVVWDWLEDETLFSWCSRLHATSPWSRREAARQLFGGSGSLNIQVAPARLEHFRKVTGGRLGETSAILRTRSLAGIAAALSGRPMATALPTRIQRPRIGGIPGMRYCHHCLCRHRQAYGVGLWRMPHHYPGVMVCADHGEPLLLTQSSSLSLHLPGELEVRPAPRIGAAEFGAHMTAAAAATLIFTAVDLDPQTLIQRTIEALCEYYRVPDGLHLDPARLQKDWAASFLGRWVARETPTLNCCKPHWISDMLRGRRSQLDPLRWTYLSTFLNELGVATPDGLFRPRSPLPGQLELWGSHPGVSAAVLNAFAHSRSFPEVATTLGIPTYTARRWSRSRPALTEVVRDWTVPRIPPIDAPTRSVGWFVTFTAADLGPVAGIV